MEYQGYPGMDPYGGMVPQGPGFIGGTMQGLGFGSPYGTMYSGMGLGQEQAGAEGAARIMNFGGNVAVPAALTALTTGAFMVAPFMQGSSNAAMSMAGSAWRLADPFTYAAPFWRGGTRAAAGAMGMSGMMGKGIGALFSAATKPIAEGGFGMIGGIGRIGMMGAGGVAASALPLAGAMAVGEGIKWAGRQVWQGAEAGMAGEAILRQMPGAALGGAPAQGQGIEFGQELAQQGVSIGASMEDMQKIVQTMGQQRLFQTTSSVREFRERFREVMDAVKEIARTAQTTIEEAQGTFGALRQQGFYTTADITAKNVRNQAREAATGISAEQYMAIGQQGAAVSRAYGMRGRFGSELMGREVASVAMGVRSGRMSEEEVEEMGGVEAVGMRLAQKQMAFLSTPRGTAIIAAMMGKGGAPDMERMSQLMSGNMTMEDIVTSAAGRGLGVLRQAQTRESKEAMMPYANMTMLMMAQSQSKQLGWGQGPDAIKRMMGTFGVNLQESEIMLQSAMGMPEQLRRERDEAVSAQERANYEELRRTQGLGARVYRQTVSKVEEPLERFGGEMYSGLSRFYRTQMEDLTGTREYRGGDDYRQAQRFLAGGGLERLQMGRGETALFGVASEEARLYQQFGGVGGAEAARRAGGQERLEQMVANRQVARSFQWEEGLGAMTMRGIPGAIEAYRRGEVGFKYTFTEDVQRQTEVADRARQALSEEERAKIRNFVTINPEEAKNLSTDQIRARLGMSRGRSQENEAVNAAIDQEIRDKGVERGRPGVGGGELINLYTAEGRREGAQQVLKQGMEVALAGEKSKSQAVRWGMRAVAAAVATPMLAIPGVGWAGAAVIAGSTEYLARQVSDLGAGGEALKRRLEEDGDARGAVDEVLELIEKGGSPTEIEAALENAKGAVKDPKAFEGLTQVIRNYQKATPEQKKQMMEGMRGGIAAVAGTERYTRAIERESGAARRMLKEGGGVSTMSKDVTDKALRTIRAGVGGEERKSAMASLWQEAAKGGIQGEEIAFIARATGTDAGAMYQFAELSAGLTGDKKQKADTRAYLKDTLKLSDDQIKKIEEEAAKGKGVKALLDTGIDPGIIAPDKSKQIEGVQTEYVEANQAFVIAVAKFVAALGESGVVSDPDLSAFSEKYSGGIEEA